MLWLGSVLLLAGGLRRDRVPVVRELTAADILATAPMIIAAFDGDGAAARAARGPVGALVAAYTQAVDRSQMGAGLRQRLGQTAQFVAEVEDDDADDDARGAPGGAGSIVGFVELWPPAFLAGKTIRGWNAADPETYVSSLVVAPAARRRGVATALMRAAEARARAERRREVTLQVEEANRAAVELYAALGYEVIGRDGRAVYRGEQYEARLYLRKELRPEERPDMHPGAPPG